MIAERAVSHDLDGCLIAAMGPGEFYLSKIGDAKAARASGLCGRAVS